MEGKILSKLLPLEWEEVPTKWGNMKRVKVNKGWLVAFIEQFGPQHDWNTCFIPDDGDIDNLFPPPPASPEPITITEPPIQEPLVHPFVALAEAFSAAKDAEVKEPEAPAPASPGPMITDLIKTYNLDMNVAESQIQAIVNIMEEIKARIIYRKVEMVYEKGEHLQNALSKEGVIHHADYCLVRNRIHSSIKNIGYNLKKMAKDLKRRKGA